jgi:hypothetical protein
MRELGSHRLMRFDQTLGQSCHVACASSCMAMGTGLSMRTSLEEGIKPNRFAGIFPEQFLTEAGRHREAVVAADQRMVIRCFRNDLAAFVHDASHVTPPIQRALSRPSCRRQNGNQDIREVADQSDTSASRNPGYVDDGSPSWVKCHAPSLVAVEQWH